MNKKVIPNETIDQLTRRTSRKTAISVNIGSSSLINQTDVLICNVCNNPNVLNVCKCCNKGMCFKCKYKTDCEYCIKCVEKNPALIDIIDAIIFEKNKQKCCVFM
jgi:hypothetical protein